MIRTMLLLLAVLAAAGMLAFVLLQPRTPSVVPPPAPAPTPEATPSEVAPVRLRLPDGFPKEHASHFLQAVNAEKPMRGVKTYFVALYWGDPESEVSVRLLGIEPGTAEKFVAETLTALTASTAVQDIGPVEMPAETGWLKGRLFSREGAGIFTASNDVALLMVSAPSPDAAKNFGISLSFGSPEQSAPPKTKEATEAQN